MGGGRMKGGHGSRLFGRDRRRAERSSRHAGRMIAATVYRGLGIDLGVELPGAQGRPIPLVDRGVEPIKELFA